MGTENFLPGGKSPSTSASSALEDIGKQLFTESQPVRQELFGQILEGLQTGGIGAKIPIIQRAVEESRIAQTQSLRQLDDQIAQGRLAGTPFGERLRADANIGANATTSRVPTDVVRDFLGVAPGFTSNAGQQSVAGLGSASSAQAAVRSAQIAAVAQIIAQSMETGQKASQGGT